MELNSTGFKGVRGDFGDAGERGDFGEPGKYYSFRIFHTIFEISFC